MVQYKAAIPSLVPWASAMALTWLMHIQFSGRNWWLLSKSTSRLIELINDFNFHVSCNVLFCVPITAIFLDKYFSDSQIKPNLCSGETPNTVKAAIITFLSKTVSTRLPEIELCLFNDFARSFNCLKESPVLLWERSILIVRKWRHSKIAAGMGWLNYFFLYFPEIFCLPF